MARGGEGKHFRFHKLVLCFTLAFTLHCFISVIASLCSLEMNLRSRVSDVS